MKLYAIWSIQENKLFAISEYKKDIRLFYLQNGYTDKDHYIYKITDKDTINNILIRKDDLYLTEYNGYMIRIKDKRPLDDIVYSYVRLLESTIDNLKTINDECIMKPAYHNKISKVCKILRYNKKKHNILRFINISSIISDYYGNNYFRDMVNELNMNL